MIWKTFTQEIPEYERLILFRKAYFIRKDNNKIPNNSSIGEISCIGKLKSTTARGHKILNSGSARVNDDGSVSLYSSGVTETTVKHQEQMENIYWTYVDEKIIDVDSEITNVDEWLKLETEKLEKEHKKRIEDLKNFAWIELSNEFFHSIDGEIDYAKKKYDEKYNSPENRNKY